MKSPPNPGTFSFSLSNYSVNENVGTATITVNRTNGATGAVAVSYATSDGSAMQPGDYTTASGVLNFANNQTSNTFQVTIIDDSDQEPNETINLMLSNPTNGAMLGAPSAATITIAANDIPPPVVLLNEVDINPPGTDTPYEYIELRGCRT